VRGPYGEADAGEPLMEAWVPGITEDDPLDGEPLETGLAFEAEAVAEAPAPEPLAAHASIPPQPFDADLPELVWTDSLETADEAEEEPVGPPAWTPPAGLEEAELEEAELEEAAPEDLIEDLAPAVEAPGVAWLGVEEQAAEIAVAAVPDDVRE